MFLRCNTRKKDGKVHRYWSVVENRRLRAGHTIQRTVLYLGEIHDSRTPDIRRLEMSALFHVSGWMA